MAKFKVNQECIDAAIEALSFFTDAELSQYVRDVYTKAKSYPDVHGMAAIDQAQKEINDEVLKTLFQDTKTKFDNVMKTDDLTKEIKVNKQNLRSFLANRGERYGKTLSVFANAAKNLLQRVAYGDLSEEEIKFLQDKNNNLSIVRALDGATSDPISKKIAKGVLAYLDKRTDMVVNSGAMPLEHINDDRMFRHIHDASKLMAAGRSWAQMAASLFKPDLAVAKPIWRTYIKDLLDLNGTFAHTDAKLLDGSLDHGVIDNILDNIFDNVTQGKNDIFSKSRIVNGQEEILKKRRMFFKFKDWESLLQYNDKYGTGDFFSMMEKDLHATAKKTGSAELLGSNPTQAYFDLKKAQQEADPSKGALWFRNTDLYYQTAMGIDQSPVSPTLANFFSNLRTFASTAALPLITVRSLPDIAHMASYAARWGMSYMDTHGYLLKHMFNVMKTEDRQYVAKLFQGMIHSDMGYTARFWDSHNGSELLRKYSMKYYRAMGLNAFDEGNKIGIMHLMANHLGNMSDTEWGGLSDALRQQLEKHDINQNEWNMLRAKTEKKLFTTDNVVNLSDSDLRKIYEGSDKSIPLHQLRTRLFNKVFSIFDIASENAVLSPGTFEKAWLYQGTAPGTATGELLRCFAQFKAFPLAYMDRVLRNGFNNAQGAEAKMAFALYLSLTGLPYSVLSNGLNSLAQGVSWQDPRELSGTEYIKYGMDNVAFNLGMYMNIAEARNQNKGLVMSMLSSPSLQLLSDAISVPAALATGNIDGAGKAFKDAAMHIVPGKQFIGWSPYMQDMLNTKPHMEPGQHLLRG